MSLIDHDTNDDLRARGEREREAERKRRVQEERERPARERRSALEAALEVIMAADPRELAALLAEQEAKALQAEKRRKLLAAFVPGGNPFER